METSTAAFNEIIEGMLREESCTYERRLRSWGSYFDPRNDFEESLVAQVVDLSFELDQVGLARREAVKCQIRSAAEVERQTVDELGQRLMFHPSGPTSMYALRPQDRCMFEKTGSGLAVDPDKPSTLVGRLMASGAGCQWLRTQWLALRERLDAGLPWQSHDRFRASRLLGRRVEDMVENREQAEMYLACFALNPVGKNAWVDLLAEMTEPQWKAYVHRLRNQWRDFQFAHDTERARQILVRLTDENIQRLTAKIEEFDSKLRDKAEQIVNLLSFDHSPRRGDDAAALLQVPRRASQRGRDVWEDPSWSSSE